MDTALSSKKGRKAVTRVQIPVGAFFSKPKSIKTCGLFFNCQKPSVKDQWHVIATKIVFEHSQNSTSVSNHLSETSGILKL